MLDDPCPRGDSRLSPSLKRIRRPCATFLLGRDRRNIFRSVPQAGETQGYRNLPFRPVPPQSRQAWSCRSPTRSFIGTVWRRVARVTRCRPVSIVGRRDRTSAQTACRSVRHAGPDRCHAGGARLARHHRRLGQERNWRTADRDRYQSCPDRQRLRASHANRNAACGHPEALAYKVLLGQPDVAGNLPDP